MEKQIENENKPERNKLILTNPDWLDLPNPIVTNIILEHLEIDDYVRFPSVCKKWQLIQNEHRIGHFPYPLLSPLPFPWLACTCCIYKNDGKGYFHCYVLNKQRSYNIPFFRTSKRGYQMGYGYGWLLHMSYDAVQILNPISGVQIRLPSLSVLDMDISSVFRTIFISSSPTDPDCTILIDDGFGNFLLCRLNDKDGWKMVEYSPVRYPGSSVFFHNKIYRVACNNKSVIMVDTLLPHPILQTIKMDYSEICATLHHNTFHLVELFEDLVMVVTTRGKDYFDIKEFHVYRADFLINKWVRMETFCDGAIFYSTSGMFALQADGVMCRKNNIYCVQRYMDGGAAWRAFDVSSRCWTNGPLLSVRSNKCQSEHGWFLFLPTLDYCLDVANTKGGCQIMSK